MRLVLVRVLYCERSSDSPLVDQSKAGLALVSCASVGPGFDLDRRLAAPNNSLHLRTHHNHLLATRLNCNLIIEFNVSAMS